MTRIDLLPEPFHSCPVIYLSKNSLNNLEGIQQFFSAHSLALSDNLIASFEDLGPIIQGCPGLQQLSLEGNPLASLPYYRSHVIQRFKSLRILDNKIVTDEEREESIRIVEQERSVMSVMVS